MEVATKSFHNQCCLKFLWFCGAFVPFTSLYLLISLQCFLANLVVDRRVGTVLVPEPFVNAQLLHIFPINHVYLRIIKMMMNVLRLSTSISMLKSPKNPQRMTVAGDQRHLHAERRKVSMSEGSGGMAKSWTFIWVAESKCYESWNHSVSYMAWYAQNRGPVLFWDGNLATCALSLTIQQDIWLVWLCFPR